MGFDLKPKTTSRKMDRAVDERGEFRWRLNPLSDAHLGQFDYIHELLNKVLHI